MTNKTIDIKKIGDNWQIILTIPQSQDRYNPYMDENTGKMDNIVGIIEPNMTKWGFAQFIDMDYKGKDDQWTDHFLDCSLFMEQEEFEKLCKENNITTIII